MTVRCVVHRNRLYIPEIYTVNYLAFDSIQRKLAVARRIFNATENAYPNVIEIWNAIEMPNLFRELVFPFKECSLEAMVWCQKRLFCAGIDGSVGEFGVHSIFALKSIQVCSSPIWCMARNSQGTLLAAGSDSGAIHLIAINENETDWNVVRLFTTAHDGRILCLAWQFGTSLLVGGCLDCIRTWDSESGRSITRIDTGRTEKSKETIIWSVAITRDSLIISGDSRGKVCFWNAKSGALISSHEMHQADVLSVCPAAFHDRTAVFAAGVDPRIHVFAPASQSNGHVHSDRSSVLTSTDGSALSRRSRDSSPKKREWRPTAMRAPHKHDVRTMVAVNDYLISSGADSMLCLTSSALKSSSIVIPPFDSSICQVAKTARMVLLRYSTELILWKLGDYSPIDQLSKDTDHILPIEDDPEKVARISSKKGAFLTSSAISTDGLVIAYSNTISTSVLRLSDLDSKPILAAFKSIHAERLPIATALAIGPKFVLLATNERHLIRADFVRDSQIIDPVIISTSFGVLGTIRSMKLSPDYRLIATITTSYEVVVFHVQTGQMTSKIALLNSIPMDLGFSDSDHLLILYGISSGKTHISEYLLAKSCFGSWTLDLTSLFYEKETPKSIQIDEDQLVVSANRKFVRIRRRKKVANGKTATVKILCNSQKECEILHSGDNLAHILSVDFLDSNKNAESELLLTQIEPVNYTNRLPSVLKMKRFGLN